ncbi:MAG: hypothetical protein PQJ46_04205, partial [Spirochaetales bacterium]|nr:hypothetical protein [Spirochaetales bacterium]
MKRYRILSEIILLASICAITVSCAGLTKKDTEVKKNQTEGCWVYNLSADGNAIILWGDGSETGENVVMFPSQLGGHTVTTIGDGKQNVSSNNKIKDNFVLFPTSVKTIRARAIYDYNDTAGWVFPGTIEKISENSLLSCQGGTFFVEKDSPVQEYTNLTGKNSKLLAPDNYKAFTVSGGENGSIQPNGSYFLPIQMLNGGYSKQISIKADYGFKINEIIIDGESYDFLQGNPKKNEIELPYSFSEKSKEISVTFTKDPSDTRKPEASESDYWAPEVIEAAIYSGANLPEDLNDYADVNGGASSKYKNTMGISTGEYYSTDGKLYKMVYSSQKQEEPEYYSKAEVINDVYNKEGFVYGKDYDKIRLYNYYENNTRGPGPGTISLYCTYLYKETDKNIEGTVRVDQNKTNTAALFVQQGGDLVVNNLIADVHTSGRGPSEAGNFFGLGSAIHVDGGDAESRAVNSINKNTARLKLVSPQIIGSVNSMYSLASGVLEINGGNIFSCSSGGHGPYVSTGGQILINTDGTELITPQGKINIDKNSLTAESRPSSDIVSMTRNSDGQMEGVFGEHGNGVTAIVTGDEAGTALATDSGGGVIVANQVSTMTYGLRCAGVYSIGFNESWVYTYNSSLVSALDAGLVSASGGYIYAFNTDISGVMGIKTRAGGNKDSDQTGIHTVNCQVSAFFDADKMKNAYDVAAPEDWKDSMADSGRGSNQLNIFLDKANSPPFNEESLDWWFKDKSLTPGYSGGNKFAVIYIENSATPVYIENTRLVNKNYKKYGSLSNPALSEGQKPADNLLVSVESGGEGNLYFKNENSRTLWDLTNKDSGSCEMVGDFYLAAARERSDNPNMGSGSNQLKAVFENSEWTGTVITADNTGITDLDFDQDSVWVITDDAVIKNLSIAS